MKMKTTLLAALCTALLAITAQAGPAFLTLTVDPTINSMTLSGFASGTPGSADVVRWNIGLQTPISTFEDIDMSTAVDQTGIVQAIRSWGDGGAYLAFRGPAFSTITTTGAVINYSFTSPTLEANFENNLDTTWTLATGTGYGDLTVVSVPEPRFYAALAGVLVLGLVVWQRRRKA